MQTVTNKKGAEGYTVTAWNYHDNFVTGEFASLDAVGPKGVIRKGSVQIAVRQVQVHSCGKKIMRLAKMEGGEFVAMRGQEFDPATAIYATRDEAEAVAAAKFEADRQKLVAYENKMRSRYEAGTYGDAVKLAGHTEVAAMLEDGRIDLEIVYP